MVFIIAHTLQPTAKLQNCQCNGRFSCAATSWCVSSGGSLQALESASWLPELSAT